MADNEHTALAMVAHADDLEAFAGGLMARLVDAGFDVYEVIATNNERGSHLLSGHELIEVSAAEARAAADILGMRDVRFLGYPDGELAAVPYLDLREQFMRLVREYRPRIVITWDPCTPYEGHPDHRAVAVAASEAAGFAHMPLFHPEHGDAGLAPHYVPYMYYFAKHPRDVNRVVNISDAIERKIDALCAHECQMHLIVQDVAMALDAAGVAWPGGELDHRNYRPIIDMAMRGRAESAAGDSDFQYGEVFRVEAFNGIVEELGQALPPEPWVE